MHKICFTVFVQTFFPLPTQYWGPTHFLLSLEVAVNHLSPPLKDARNPGIVLSKVHQLFPGAKFTEPFPWLTSF